MLNTQSMLQSRGTVALFATSHVLDFPADFHLADQVYSQPL